MDKSCGKKLIEFIVSMDMILFGSYVVKNYLFSFSFCTKKATHVVARNESKKIKPCSLIKK
jgi:hypothetical protein